MACEPPCDLGFVMHELYLLSFPGVLVVGGDGSIVTMRERTGIHFPPVPSRSNWKNGKNGDNGSRSPTQVTDVDEELGKQVPDVGNVIEMEDSLIEGPGGENVVTEVASERILVAANDGFCMDGVETCSKESNAFNDALNETLSANCGPGRGVQFSTLLGDNGKTEAPLDGPDPTGEAILTRPISVGSPDKIIEVGQVFDFNLNQQHLMMEDMDIDHVVDIPDTPDRPVARHINDGDCIGKESKLSVTGHLGNPDFKDEECLHRSRCRGQLVGENGHNRRLHMHPRKNPCSVIKSSISATPLLCLQ
ncbi:hypothetical protein LWI29_019142 [Acer saccharum]|uniref:Uncharacterized protein n=1 Tax=Acer saccharum TaxID=4024 RepID=A0AA39W2R0_ACESA|nr:hypothetical protein LWI29_019142 [Acer saccharum]